MEEKQPGALAGEGSSFFVLSSEKNDNTLAEVIDTQMFFRPESNVETGDRTLNFLKKNSLIMEDIDLVILGYNGDSEFDNIYTELESTVFSENTTAYYKHLSGEYDTSSAFAMWLASGIIKESKIPDIIIKKGNAKKEICNVLIYNHFRNINHSLILLSKT